MSRGRRATIAGEATRIRHALERLKASLPVVEMILLDAERERIVAGAEVSQALVSTCFEVVTGLAKIDAIIWSTEGRSSRDAAER